MARIERRWTNQHGAERVIETALGHNNSTMQGPACLDLVTCGIHATINPNSEVAEVVQKEKIPTSGPQIQLRRSWIFDAGSLVSQGFQCFHRSLTSEFGINAGLRR